MPINLVQESDESIKFFSNFLSHLRFMRGFNSDISIYFSTEEEKKNLEDFYKLNDISSLITICHLDLITNVKNLYLAKSDWEKIFFIKNLFLVIYETINSFHKHGKFLFSKSQATPNILELYRTANDDLKSFKHNYKYNTHINKIRNNISGHINDNFEEYYDEIMNFDGDKTAKMASSFFRIIEKIQNLLNELMKTIKLDYSKIDTLKHSELQEKLDKFQ